MLSQIPLSFQEGINQLTSGPDFTVRKLSTAVKVPLREEKTLLGIYSHQVTKPEYTLVDSNSKPLTFLVEKAESHLYLKVKETKIKFHSSLSQQVSNFLCKVLP